MTTRRAAFTLTELLAVLVIIGLLMATFVPYAMSIRETSNRVRCADNLRNIRKALEIYGEKNTFDNRELLPRVRFDPARGGAWTAFTGADDEDPFVETSRVRPNDVTASMWLLIRDGRAQPEWFVCPSSGGRPDAMQDANGDRVAAKQRGNFRGPANLSYAMASPFSAVEEYRWNRDAFSSRFALMADQGPAIDQAAKPADRPAFDAGTRSLRSANSPNHGGEGQNVLYADGSVSFETSPYCGVGRTVAQVEGRSVEAFDGDDIYSALADQPLVDSKPKHNSQGIVGQTIGPAYRYDAMLVPAAEFVDHSPLPPRPVATPTSDAAVPASTQATQP